MDTKTEDVVITILGTAEPIVLTEPLTEAGGAVFGSKNQPTIGCFIVWNRPTSAQEEASGARRSPQSQGSMGEQRAARPAGRLAPALPVQSLTEPPNRRSKQLRPNRLIRDGREPETRRNMD